MALLLPKAKNDVCAWRMVVMEMAVVERFKRPAMYINHSYSQRDGCDLLKKNVCIRKRR